MNKECPFEKRVQFVAILLQGYCFGTLFSECLWKAECSRIIKRVAMSVVYHVPAQVENSARKFCTRLLGNRCHGDGVQKVCAEFSTCWGTWYTTHVNFWSHFGKKGFHNPLYYQNMRFFALGLIFGLPPSQMTVNLYTCIMCAYDQVILPFDLAIFGLYNRTQIHTYIYNISQPNSCNHTGHGQWWAITFVTQGVYNFIPLCNSSLVFVIPPPLVKMIKWLLKCQTKNCLFAHFLLQ